MHPTGARPARTPQNMRSLQHFFRVTAALLALLAAGPTAAQTTSHTGTLVELWTDPARGSAREPRLDHVLLEDGGGWLLLDVDAAVLRALGGGPALRGRRVVVTGEIEGGPEGAVRAGEGAGGPGTPPRLRVESLEAAGPAPAPGAALPPSPRYVTVLCRFPGEADDGGVQSKATYLQWLGEEYPGMNHYWRAISRDRVDFHGQVNGWYQLPAGLDHYFDDPAEGERTKPDWGLLARDCAALADPDIDFTGIDGLNLQFNVDFGASWGGGSRLTLDGPERAYAVTWLAAWAGQSVYAHEMGHSFGLPHSSGPYGETYDSRWDVMSNGYIHWDPVRRTYIGQGTNIYHRDLLGWVPPERKLVADRFGETETVRLEFWDGEPGPGYEMLEIPLDDGTFYSVGARRLLGYDESIPFRGVVIHHVDTERPNQAQVVDPDDDGDPNDEGAVWTPGETFVDPEGGVEITVTEAVGTDAEPGAGYRLEVTRGWRLHIVVDGQGRVWTPDGDLECDASCTSFFGDRGPVILEAEAADGLFFGGWSGACWGGGQCAVTLGTGSDVTAHFVDAVALDWDAERPAGTVGAQYRDSLVAHGGMGQYLWSVTDGALPEGVLLDPGKGVLYGIPREAGSFDAEVTVTSGALEAVGAVHMEVDIPVLERARVLDGLLGAPGVLTDAEVRYLDIAGNDNGSLDIGDVYLFLGREGG